MFAVEIEEQRRSIQAAGAGAVAQCFEAFTWSSGHERQEQRQGLTHLWNHFVDSVMVFILFMALPQSLLVNSENHKPHLQWLAKGSSL